MLAYIVLHYDLKSAGDGGRPPNVHIGTTVLPAMDGQVMFRKRDASAFV